MATTSSTNCSSAASNGGESAGMTAAAETWQKRPRSLLFQRNQDELPAAGFSFAATNNTKDTSRVRKKKKKKAQQEQELILFSAQNAQFTGSVRLDSSSSSVHDAQVTSRSLDNSAGKQQPQIQVTTCSVLPDPDIQQQGNNFPPSSYVQRNIIRIHVQPLLVLDLNGILCHRIRSHKEPPLGAVSYRTATMHVANTAIIPRTDLEGFLSFLNAHFCLAVWTSAQPKTAKKLVRALFPEPVARNLLFCWGQNRCHQNVQQPGGKVLFEKQLDKVWNEFPLWNQFTTLLIDDSPDKCSSFRHNALHPPPLHGQEHQPVFVLDDNSNGGTAFSGADVNNDDDDGDRATNYQDHCISDEANHSLQMEFFTKLVDYWKEHPSETSWNEQGEIQCNKESEAIWSFLEENAMDHMGWKM